MPHTKVGALRYAADVFTSWQDNLRAIALGLEAMRRVERYGITKNAEQYAGFRVLPAGRTPGEMTVEEAVVAIHLTAGGTGPIPDPDDAAAVKALYRAAARLVHPDRTGSTAQFQDLEVAAEILLDAKLL